LEKLNQHYLLILLGWIGGVEALSQEDEHMDST
jgi:hypothetical protein